MSLEKILEELEELGASFDISIRYEKGDFDGGYCIFKAERVIVINKKISPQRKISILYKAFENFGLSKDEMTNELRESIEDELVKLKLI